MSAPKWFLHRWIVVDRVTVPDYADPNRNLHRDPSTIERPKSFRSRAAARAEAANRGHADVIDGKWNHDRECDGRPAWSLPHDEEDRES